MRVVELKEFGGVENFREAERPEPVPGPGEVKIRTKMISVNPTDYKARAGTGGAAPIVLGRDAAGAVEAVGEGVEEFAPGDEVMCYLPRHGDSGGEGYAECVKVAAEFVEKKPANISVGEAAAVPLVSLTAYDCVAVKARAGEGDSAFVAGGSGGVGTMGIQFLRRLGADPILATAGSDESAAYLTDFLGLPPENILRYAGLSIDDLAARVQEMNGGRLVRAVFDFVGKDMKRLCARVVDYWGCLATITPEPGEPLPEMFSSTEGPFFTKSASLHCVFLRSPVRGGGKAYWGMYKEEFRVIREWLEAGEVKPPAITDLGPMTAGTIREAHRMLEAGHTRGKIVLSVG